MSIEIVVKMKRLLREKEIPVDIKIVRDNFVSAIDQDNPYPFTRTRKKKIKNFAEFISIDSVQFEDNVKETFWVIHNNRLIASFGACVSGYYVDIYCVCVFDESLYDYIKEFDQIMTEFAIKRECSTIIYEGFFLGHENFLQLLLSIGWEQIEKEDSIQKVL